MTRLSRLALLMLACGFAWLPAAHARGSSPSADVAGAAQAQLHSFRPEGATSGSASYSDAAGDATLGGLDITNVTVANNDQPNIHLSIPFSSASTLPTDITVTVLVDTDLAVDSAGLVHAEYDIEIQGNTRATYLYKWNGSSFVFVSPQPASLHGSFSAGATIDILGADLGLGSAFNFWIHTLRLSGGTYVKTDETAAWRYNVVLGGPPPPPTQKLKVTGWAHSPTAPRAGGSFVTALKVVDPATNKSVSKGAVSCAASLDGKPLKGSGYYDFNYGTYDCIWQIPRAAAGKGLIATEEVTYNGASVSRTFQGTVKARKTPSRTLKIYRVEHKVPTAGAAFQATFTAAWISGKNVRDPIVWRSAKAICSARIVGDGAIQTTSVERFGFGVRCTWFVPYSARGRKLVFTLVIRSRSYAARKSFVARAS